MPEIDQIFSSGLCGLLAEHGLEVGIRTELVVGETDTRLHAGLPGARREVELLGTLADLPLPPRWQAVRVESENRSVWEGPSRHSSQSELRTFVWDLACLGYERLSRRWRRLE